MLTFSILKGGSVEGRLGRVLSVLTGVHCSAKKELNNLAFSLEFVIKVLLERIGGIIENINLPISFFSEVWYAFGPVCGLFNLLPSLCKYLSRESVTILL